jgi:hypothetical protein
MGMRGDGIGQAARVFCLRVSVPSWFNFPALPWLIGDDLQPRNRLLQCGDPRRRDAGAAERQGAQ